VVANESILKGAPPSLGPDKSNCFPHFFLFFPISCVLPSFLYYCSSSVTRLDPAVTVPIVRSVLKKSRGDPSASSTPSCQSLVDPTRCYLCNITQHGFGPPFLSPGCCLRSSSYSAGPFESFLFSWNYHPPPIFPFCRSVANPHIIVESIFEELCWCWSSWPAFFGFFALKVSVSSEFSRNFSFTAGPLHAYESPELAGSPLLVRSLLIILEPPFSFPP